MALSTNLDFILQSTGDKHAEQNRVQKDYKRESKQDLQLRKESEYRQNVSLFSLLNLVFIFSYSLYTSLFFHGLLLPFHHKAQLSIKGLES